MFRQFVRPAVCMLLAMTLLTGIIYPLLVTGVALAVFPRQAGGSLLVENGQTVGSSLIGQPFDNPKYFWSRPSATAPFAYNAAASSGSNLGPIEPLLLAAVKDRVQKLHEADPGNTEPVPVDLVTASASGLDPHISPAAAAYQVARVARVRGLQEQDVRDLAARHTEPRWLGVLGEPRVNVVELNLALDRLGR